jgi:hypothetical protein
MRSALVVSLQDYLLPKLSETTLTQLAEELVKPDSCLIHTGTTNPRASDEDALNEPARGVCLLGLVAKLEFGARTVLEVEQGVLRLCTEMESFRGSAISRAWDEAPEYTREVVQTEIGRELERRKAA